MKETLALISRQQHLIRTAVVQGGDVISVDVDVLERLGRCDGIYLGRVQKKQSSYYWIDLGLSRPGLLPLEKRFPSLNEGEYTFVQITREAFADSAEIKNHQQKGVQLTRNLTYVSCNFIFQPYSSTLFRDRQVRGDDLENQTALKYLHQTVLQFSKEKKPTCVLPGVSVWQRCLRDLPDASQVLINDFELLALAKAYCQQWRRDLHLSYQAGDLFFEHGLDEAWQQSLCPVVDGGTFNLVFEETACVSSIDVNSDAQHAKGSNLEAIPLIAQQLIWRRLSGRLIIDFINPGSKDRQLLVETLQVELNRYHSKWQICGWSRLGFLELLLPRHRLPLSQIINMT